MSITTRAKIKLEDAIRSAFFKIGTTNGSAMPQSTNNLEPVAWELLVAQRLATLATKRKEVAEHAAVEARVINDKDKQPYSPGTRTITYNGSNVQVMVEVRPASKRVNVEEMIAYLARNGVKQSLLDEALVMATSMTRPAHIYSSVLVTDD